MQIPEKANPTEDNQTQVTDNNKIKTAKGWLAENRDAIVEYNQFVEQFGAFGFDSR